MKYVIECWKDHHWAWDEKEIRTINDLYKLLHNGYLWHKEDDRHDEKVTITIETED